MKEWLDQIEDEDPLSWISFLRRGMREVEAESDEAGEESYISKRAAKEWYRENMPPLTSRRMVQCYIGCIAAGFQSEVLNGDEARAMMYIAQTALSGFKEPTKPGRPLKNLHAAELPASSQLWCPLCTGPLELSNGRAWCARCRDGSAASQVVEQRWLPLATASEPAAHEDVTEVRVPAEHAAPPVAQQSAPASGASGEEPNIGTSPEPQPSAHKSHAAKTTTPLPPPPIEVNGFDAGTRRRRASPASRQKRPAEPGKKGSGNQRSRKPAR